MSEHTKGEWVTSEGLRSVMADANRDRPYLPICSLTTLWDDGNYREHGDKDYPNCIYPDKEEMDANARLIGQAPKMKELLRFITNQTDTEVICKDRNGKKRVLYWDNKRTVVEEARAILRRIEGGE